MFPYESQKPYNHRHDRCRKIDGTYRPNVRLKPCEVLADSCSTTPCSPEEMCGRADMRFITNRLPDSKWDGGVPKDVYIQERNLVASYNTCNCFPDNQSCSCPSPDSDLVPENGGVCRCIKLTPNRARCFSWFFRSRFGCADLTTTESLVVFNGKEDIFIQWLYGKYLVKGYYMAFRRFGKLINYDDNQSLQAGHALPLQSPAWMQDQIYDHLR